MALSDRCRGNVCGVQGERIELGAIKSGHLFVKMIPVGALIQSPSDKREEPVYATDSAKILSEDQVRKLHLQIGHGSFGAIKRLLILIGYSVDDSIIKQSVAK